MLLHDNYILFLVNLKAVLKLRCKVKCTYCLLYEKCIFVMAESDKTLKEDVNLSNNNRNNSVPNIIPISSGTVISDTHPTHHAAVSEPSTLKRKQTSFQITSVTVKGSRLSTDGGEDSADDLDESHTEDASSDILDCSRNTDVDNDQFSEDNSNPTNNDHVSSTALSNAVKCKKEIPVKHNTPNDVAGKLPTGASKSEELSLSSENPQSDYVKPPDLPDQWQHRFRVVKIVSSEPFKRGRWLCLDFVDPPAPVTEAKAEIVESSVSPNIQLISSSLPESIPADKIAHIYEISPGDAYPGSISVAVGSDKVQQPMYGIFLPINNGQYPLITGMHSKAIARPMEKELTVPEPMKSSEQGNQSQCIASSAQPTPNIPSAVQNPPNVTPSLQQTQQNVPVGSKHNTASNLQQPQNVSSNVQAINSSMQPSAQQPSVSQHMSTTLIQQNVATQQQPPVTSSMQPQMGSAPQEVKNVQSQNISSGIPQHGTQQNVNAGMQSAQNISSNIQQTISGSVQKNASAVQQPNVSNNVELQYQNVNVHLAQGIIQPNVPQNAGAAPQPKVGNSQSQPNVNQQESAGGQNVSVPPQPQNASICVQQAPEGFQHAVHQPSNTSQSVLENQQQAITFQQQKQNAPLNPAIDPKLTTAQPSELSAVSTSLNIAPNNPQHPSRESQLPGMQQVSHPIVHSQAATSTTASSTVSKPTPEVSSMAPPVVEMSQGAPMQQLSAAQTTTVGTQASSVSIPETVVSVANQETVVPSQATQNHIDAKEQGTPPSTNLQVSQEVVSDVPSSKGDVNGEESESVPSGTSTVAIDNKIEQAMDLVKSHLMFAVREEVDVLKEKITELMDRISQLEYENSYLRANASQQTLEQLNQSQLLQQQQQQPLTVSMNSIPAVPQQSLPQTQLNIQNQQPTS